MELGGRADYSERENCKTRLGFPSFTRQKMKFPIKNFLSKCDQIPRILRIWYHLLKKSLMENFFCAVFILNLPFLKSYKVSLKTYNPKTYLLHKYCNLQITCALLSVQHGFQDYLFSMASRTMHLLCRCFKNPTCPAYQSLLILFSIVW